MHAAKLIFYDRGQTIYSCKANHQSAILAAAKSRSVWIREIKMLVWQTVGIRTVY